MNNWQFTIIAVAYIAGVVALAIFVSPWFGLLFILMKINSRDDN